MKKLIILVVIIAFLAVFVPNRQSISEWLSVNIFTVSTRAKQQEKLTLAEKHLRAALDSVFANDETGFKSNLQSYKDYLLDSEDMAEKIIFLDGAEIALAEKFESATRAEEQTLAQALKNADPKFQADLFEALAVARSENEKVFKFMAKNYQQTDADIAKHKAILAEHIKIVQMQAQGIADKTQKKKIADFLNEAEKFRKAGLNLQAYDLIDQAKNIVY